MRSSVVLKNRPPKPVFIFDGDCGFCRRRVERWRALCGREAEFVSAPDSRFPEIPLDFYVRSSLYIGRDGKVYVGAEAIFRLLALKRGQFWLGAYQRVPGFAWVAEWVYRSVASHRLFLSRIENVLRRRSAD